MISRVLQSVTVLFITLLALFAAVQYNDPDGLQWIAVYGFASLLGVAAITGQKVRLIAFFAIIAYGAGFLYLLPHDLRGWINIEEAREAFGLLICIGWFGFLIGTDSQMRLQRKLKYDN